MMFEGIKIRKAVSKLLAIQGKPFLWETDKESPFEEVIDGKRYIYSTMKNVHISGYDKSISLILVYRKPYSLCFEHISIDDPREFVSKTKEVSSIEFKKKTSGLWNEITTELLDSKWAKFKDRVYEIKWHFNYPSPDPYCSYDKTWEKQELYLTFKAMDVTDFTIRFHTPEEFMDKVTLQTDSKAFEQSEAEYLEKKSKEFEGLGIGDVRYCESKSETHRDIIKVVAVNTYKYGENDMYVEYELHHMSDDTNKVETFVSEFNEFRTKYSKNEI